jgi:hypothetical protein
MAGWRGDPGGKDCLIDLEQQCRRAVDGRETVATTQDRERQGDRLLRGIRVNLTSNCIATAFGPVTGHHDDST